MYILDWSTERSRREFYWTGGKYVPFIRDHVLYEFLNKELIMFYMYNILLYEKKL